jgi:hypothetical protein
MTKIDGTPSLTKGGKQRYAHHHVLGVDCDRNAADINLGFYWRAHGRCKWSNSPVPLDKRRRRGCFTELPPPMASAPPFGALGAWEDAPGNSESA